MEPPPAIRRSGFPVSLLIVGIVCLLLIGIFVSHSLYQALQLRFHSPPNGDAVNNPLPLGPTLESRFGMPVDLSRLRAIDIQVLYNDAVFRLAERTVRMNVAQKAQGKLLVRHLPGGFFDIFGTEVIPPGIGKEPLASESIRFEQIGLGPPETARAAYPEIISITDQPVSLAEVPSVTGIWLFSMLVDALQRRIQVELGWSWTISSTYYFQYQVGEDGRLKYLGYGARGCAPSPTDFVKIEEPAG